MVPLLAVIFPAVASQPEVCPDDARVGLHFEVAELISVRY
jgi:hypothetical protein